MMNNESKRIVNAANEALSKLKPMNRSHILYYLLAGAISFLISIFVFQFHTDIGKIGMIMSGVFFALTLLISWMDKFVK